MIFARLLFLWLLLSPPAAAYTIEEIARADALLRLLDHRLRISERVAQAKWNSGAPIEDVEREKQVKDAFVSRAVEAGTDPRLAEAFVVAQIEASKVRQGALIRSWADRRLGPFPDPPDLVKEIRPQLDELSAKLLEALGTIETHDAALLLWRAEILWGLSPDSARRRALQGWL